MRTLILTTMVLLCCTVSVSIGYDREITEGYFEVITLPGYSTLLMTGGGAYSLYLQDYNYAIIQGTSPLVENYGGIWELGMWDDAQLDFSGGEVHEFDISSGARAVFSGGRIDEIRSTQHVEDIPVGDPPVGVPDPHIEIFCRDHEWDEPTNILTGTWFDDSTFDIQLVNVTGYDPVIDNIFFTPEPATLLLITIGGLLLRRRKCHM